MAKIVTNKMCMLSAAKTEPIFSKELKMKERKNFCQASCFTMFHMLSSQHGFNCWFGLVDWVFLITLHFDRKQNAKKK